MTVPPVLLLVILALVIAVICGVVFLAVLLPLGLSISSGLEAIAP